MESELLGKLAKYRLRTHQIASFTLLWAILIVLVLSWQAFAYRGLVAWLAELQFDYLRRFYPLATVALITFLLILPLLIVLLVRSSRRRTGKLLKDEPGALVRRARLASRDLLAASIFTALLAALIAGYALWIGRGATPVAPAAGPAVIPAKMGQLVSVHGTLRRDRLAYYGNEAILFQRNLWVVPLEEGPNQPFRFFVEMKVEKPEPAVAGRVTAFADTNGLPGPIVRLYENAGYQVGQRTVVLYTSLEDLRAPYWQAARTMLVVALVLGITGLFERRWLRYLRRQVRRPALEGEASQTS